MACIKVDYDKCTGLGICESLAPEFFEVSDDGNLTLLEEEAGPDALDDVREAVAGCPTEALSLKE
ncbi:ferredoxin [Actinomycetospora chibensis]|uniref:Ferredoxin n=1 Tax=Actinomycetospora chibensis TaxID=663606 RepID=A0ABV9REB5_9PSEU|nr:ferredoxin [Actinomycetospora chibensis]MDD7925076.1 ferredoxin [Actinomycetospora chibensis]